MEQTFDRTDGYGRLYEAGKSIDLMWGRSLLLVLHIHFKLLTNLYDGIEYFENANDEVVQLITAFQVKKVDFINDKVVTHFLCTTGLSFF